MESFFELIQAGDAAAVAAQLAAEPTLREARHTAGVSLIRWALYHGQQAVAERLVAEGVSPDCFDAAALGALDDLKRLIGAHPAGVNAVSEDGFSLLGLAAFFGQLETLHYLLGAGATANKPSDNTFGVYPIHSAVAHRQPAVSLAMTRALLAAGAAVNVAQQGGWTPLHQAAAHGQREMVEVLRAAGADPQARSDDQRTPADMAEEKGFADLAALLTP